MKYELYHGDCLEVMPALVSAGAKVDAIIVDLPYGTTNCAWDTIIPLDRMWACVEAICSKRTPIIMFGQQPFTSALVMSNPGMFKYEWVWEKTSPTGHLNAKLAPMKAHENILVFYKKQPTYNPIRTTGHERKTATRKTRWMESGVYGKQNSETPYDSTDRYPRSVVVFPKDTQRISLHSTQKPVDLLSYLIRTYSNAGDTILDFTMGSGTCGVACLETGRSFIGIEKDEIYFKVAKERIEKTERFLSGQPVKTKESVVYDLPLFATGEG